MHRVYEGTSIRGVVVGPHFIRRFHGERAYHDASSVLWVASCEPPRLESLVPAAVLPFVPAHRYNLYYEVGVNGWRWCPARSTRAHGRPRPRVYIYILYYYILLYIIYPVSSCPAVFFERAISTAWFARKTHTRTGPGWREIFFFFCKPVLTFVAEHLLCKSPTVKIPFARLCW